MVKHPWPLMEISLSDFRKLATLNIDTYLPMKVYFEDGRLSFAKKQTKHLHVVGLQRHWWIFRSNIIADSPHPPKSEQKIMVTCGQQYRL